MKTRSSLPLLSCLLLSLSAASSQAQLLWSVGKDDNGWPTGVGGGENANFVQENGTINPLPGNPASPVIDRQADNDYYFAGDYSNTIESVTTFYAPYDPVGTVDANEEAAERAFAGADNDLRYHFNLPDSLLPTDLLTVTFDALNLDDSVDAAKRRYGVEVYFNGVLVQPQIVIRPAQLGKTYQTAQFSLESVNAQVGAGYDNIVSLKGISYSNDGGGAWMGIDYIKLDQQTVPVAAPVFPWAVGKDDNGFPVGDGGGENTTFVQENGVINPLPGSPTSPEVDQQSDNDYYFAGSYSKKISTVVGSYGDYTPVGDVSVNEESAERAFAGGDNDLRYHFNLPNELSPETTVSVSYKPLSLDTTGANPRYGVAVYFNGILVQPEIVVTPDKVGKIITTPAFSLGSVKAEMGPGFDNIVSLRGINHSADGGGNWMAFDFVQLNPDTAVAPAATLPLLVGRHDGDWPAGDGGGPDATFVQENGVVNPLPGVPNSPEANGQADNDYYFAGSYTTVSPSVVAMYGNYSPVGVVTANEEAAERAFAGGDTEQRYHFNLPLGLLPTDRLTVTFDANNLDDSVAEATRRMGVEVYFNGVLVGPQVLIRPPQLGVDVTTAPFSLSSVNAGVGPGYDNIVTLKGVSYANDGGGNWMGIDAVAIRPNLGGSLPWAVGMDDDAWPVGNGGGPRTSFMQENGVINPLPGNPNSPETDQQSDNDYYFRGDYNTTIDSVVALYGDYTPVGFVAANEESAERAFAAADDDLRYHFNLPDDLKPDDLLTVTFDANNLHTGADVPDPRYGVQVYFNGILVQDEIVIRPPDLNKTITVPPFTAASVNARPGSGFDNIVSLKGINYNSDGGGNWMGIDYVMLNPIRNSPFPLAVGKKDATWAVGTGGGPETTFVQENGGVNALPGKWTNPVLDGRSDNDYYFAGDYSSTITSVTDFYGAYNPIGLVPSNEEGAERAFAGGDTDLRYHFNLPDGLKPDDMLTVTFDALNLDDSGSDPHYGVQVYFNGVLVQDEIAITPPVLNTDFTTPPFSLATVNAQVGRGYDNILTLRAVRYSGSGGGNWMGLDYVQVNPVPPQFDPPVVTGDGKVRLNWTGPGALEWAPTVTGPWTTVTPAVAPPYSELVVPGQNRFFRLRIGQ